ncbi:hypothetical protein ACRASX_00295 [Flavobacterium sp. TMP13]|uniref:hypothetical protein n=1 Tax=Flavobacterium sp. TMP13 TaxID=3425950 RepID=UPI003D7780D0
MYDVDRNGQTMMRYYSGPHMPMVDIPANRLRVVRYIRQSEINAYPGKLTQNP